MTSFSHSNDTRLASFADYVGIASDCPEKASLINSSFRVG